MKEKAQQALDMYETELGVQDSRFEWAETMIARYVCDVDLSVTDDEFFPLVDELLIIKFGTVSQNYKIMRRK